MRFAPARGYLADSASPGGDPPDPSMRFAPARWYLADTPALAGPRGPGSLAGNDRFAVTRCGARR